MLSVCQHVPPVNTQLQFAGQESYELTKTPHGENSAQVFKRRRKKIDEEEFTSKTHRTRHWHNLKTDIFVCY